MKIFPAKLIGIYRYVDKSHGSEVRMTFQNPDDSAADPLQIDIYNVLRMMGLNVTQKLVNTLQGQLQGQQFYIRDSNGVKTIIDLPERINECRS